MKVGRFITRMALTSRFPFITSAQIFLERGIKNADCGNVAQAVRDFERASALKPRLPEPQRRMGETLLAFQQPERAIAHFENALRLDSSDRKTWLSCLAALVIAGRRDEAGARLGMPVEMFADFAVSKPAAATTAADLPSPA